MQTLRERRAKREPAALTAGGARVSATTAGQGQTVNADQVRRLKRPWQTRAFEYYDIVPEIWYAAQFYSRHMSKIELRVEHYDEARDEWTPQPDSKAQGLLNRIRDLNGGRGELIGAYGRLRFLVGECYVVCADPETATEKWEVLSVSEIQPNDGGKGYKRIRAEGFQAEDLAEAPDDNDFDPLPESARVWRLWRRHPRYSMQADSPLRACMDVAEELCLMTLAVRAQARSRIAKSGLLLIPSEISPPPPEPRPGENPKEDTFLRNLTLHMEAPLADEGTPAQLVPLVVRGPAAHLDAIRQLQLHVSGADYPEAQLRTEAIGRLANGLDMPREALLGTADVNHWGSWQIDQQTWSAHVQPVVEDMCMELTSAILRPALEQDEEVSVGEAETWRIWYDAAKITNHPDRGKDAQDVYDRGSLSKAALREAKGFDESDAPSEAERAEWIGVRVRDAGLAWFGKPTLKAGATGEGGTPLDETQQGGETGPPDGGTGNDVVVGPPVSGAAVERLLGAAETAMWTCRRTAGSRLIQKVPRADRAKLASIPKTQLFASLGSDAAANLNGDPRVGDPYWLVQGGTEAFEQALEGWGYPPERVSAIATIVRDHSARTLHMPEPEALPPILLNA